MEQPTTGDNPLGTVGGEDLLQPYEGFLATLTAALTLTWRAGVH